MTFSSKVIAACALTVLLGMGMLSFRSTVRDEEDRGWVTHTYLVIEKLQAVLVDVDRAETGKRGYLLTRQDWDLEEYRGGINRVQQDVRDLRDMTSDNPVQQEAIRGLDLTVARESMNEIRGQIGEMRSTEERLLKIRLKAAAVATRRMKAVIVLGNALSISYFVGGGFCHPSGGQQTQSGGEGVEACQRTPGTPDGRAVRGE